MELGNYHDAVFALQKLVRNSESLLYLDCLAEGYAQSGRLSTAIRTSVVYPRLCFSGRARPPWSEIFWGRAVLDWSFLRPGRFKLKFSHPGPGCFGLKFFSGRAVLLRNFSKAWPAWPKDLEHWSGRCRGRLKWLRGSSGEICSSAPLSSCTMRKNR